ncbi:Cyanovirin-N [Mycena polygramma]|nr:Cyanovirin-N [Mycena polygramma]
MTALLSYLLLALYAVAAAPGAVAASTRVEEALVTSTYVDEVVSTTTPVEERAAQTNFSATCTGISFNASNNNLTATCQRSGGIGSTTSTIGLNSCVGNTNGILTAGNSFSSSCSSISFSGVTLSALCTNPAGTTIRTSLNLNSVLSNTNGILTCP